MSDNKAAVVPMGLTPRQANIALMAWKAVDGDIKVDCNRLAKLTGYDTMATARRQHNKAKLQVMNGTSSGPNDLLGMTTRALEVVLMAWKCVDDVKIDADKLAPLTGYKSATTARRQWNKVKKQIADATVNNITGTVGPEAAENPQNPVGVTTAEAPKVPKRKRAAKVDDADDSAPDTLPKKAKKMAKGKKAQDKKEDTEEERAGKEMLQKEIERLQKGLEEIINACCLQKLPSDPDSEPQ